MIPVKLNSLRWRDRRMGALVRTAGLAVVAAFAGGGMPSRAVAQSSAASTAGDRDVAPRNAPPLVLGTIYQQLATASPRLEAAQALARAAEARVPGARRPPDPQLQLGFMNRELPSLKPMDPLGMTQLQLMQMVPVAGKLGLAGDVAAAQAAAARNRAADVRWDVRAQAAMAFYDLYQTDQSLDVAIATRRLLQDIATTAQTMYAVGEGRQPDVLRAQVEIARMTEDIVRMETMRTGMDARLAALLNRAPQADPASPVLPALPAQLPPLDSLIRLAQANRPMIQAGREELRGADAAAALARRELWPDIEVGVQYGWRAGPMGMGTEQMGSLMLGASIPVFARSRQLQLREEAAAMRTMAAADLAAMRAETAGRIASAYADWRRARNLSDLYRSTILPQAQATITSSLAAYRVGDVNFMTLLDNQMTLNRYQQELSALVAEQGKAVAELEMLIGRELFDPNVVAAPAAGSER
jgi:outer membrane protein TolC